MVSPAPDSPTKPRTPPPFRQGKEKIPDLNFSLIPASHPTDKDDESDFDQNELDCVVKEGCDWVALFFLCKGQTILCPEEPADLCNKLYNK